MSDQLSIIEVSCEPIELYKVLKIANMVGGGGEAKIVISEGYVFLNGEVETQKRKKIYQDDIIEFNGEAIQINVVAVEVPAQSHTQSNTQPNKSDRAQSKKQQKNKPAKNKASGKSTEQSSPFSASISAGKRKPISF